MKSSNMYSKIILFVVLLVGLVATAKSQSKQGVYYYVSAEKAVLYNDTVATSAPLQQLKKYDNLTLVKTVNNQWKKVRLANAKTTGFVQFAKIDKGKAVAETSRYRVGAVCEDGTRSDATGRGACSWHGGVDRWLYETSQWYRIVNDNN